MKVYSPAEIAQLLNVKESTLRKYSLMLEETGYSFKKNQYGKRWYNDSDVIALQKLVSFKNSGDMTLKESVNAVYLWASGNDITTPSTYKHDDTKQHDSDITELKEIIHKQTKLIEKQRQDQEKQNKLIEELTRRLDRQHETMMESLKEHQETQKQIAAAEEKKTIFQKLFKK